MAALSDADRSAIRAAVAAELSRIYEPCAVSKTEMKAAVDGIDDWVEANKAAFNAAIPLPARTALTAAQKARLLAHVVRKRFETGA